MLMLAGRRTIVSVLLLQLLLSCLLAATGRAEDVANSTLADVIANTTGVDTLRGLIKSVPGLLDSLDNAAGPLTVFAPTDAAFEELVEAAPALVANLAGSEGWVVHLTDVLTYHVVPGKFTSKNLFNKTATKPIVVTALNDEDVTIATVKNGTALAITDITDRVSNVTKPFDVIASNGVIHTIDRVLLPYWTTLSIVESGKLLDDFSILVSLVVQVGLEEALSGYGDDDESLGLTLFAPMNSAFDGIDTAALTDEQIKDILLYHVVPGVVPSTALTTGKIATLQGGTIAVVAVAAAGDKDASFTVNGNPVVFADELANNGIVHVIDKVLMPPTDEAPPEKCPPLSSVRSRKNRHRV